MLESIQHLHNCILLQSGDVSSYDDAVDAIEPDESSGLHIPIAEVVN